MINNQPNKILSGMPQAQQDPQMNRTFQQYQDISGAGTLPMNPVYSATAKFNQLGGTTEVDYTNELKKILCQVTEKNKFLQERKKCVTTITIKVRQALEL
jgi:hypothetical protein